MTTTDSGPWTVRSVLFEDSGLDPADALARSIEAGGVGGALLHHLGGLSGAARRTLVVPGSEEVVDLVSHRIRSVHRPDVAVLVDGVRVAKIDFELKVVFEVGALVAVVRAGRLVALRGGRCDLDATLSAEGIPLAQQHKRFDLGARLPLGSGVELVAPESPSVRDPAAV
jgi:hypothetical protein